MDYEEQLELEPLQRSWSAFLQELHELLSEKNGIAVETLPYQGANRTIVQVLNDNVRVSYVLMSLNHEKEVRIYYYTGRTFLFQIDGNSCLILSQKKYFNLTGSKEDISRGEKSMTEISMK